MNAATPSEHSRRWRLILGGHAEEALGQGLSGEDRAIDRTLDALYDSDRKGGLGSSSPNVPRWLGDIRQYFSKSVVQVMQRDAMERFNLQQMLFEPETLEALEADVHLVATLLSLRGVMPAKTRDTARMVVQKVVDELMRKLANPVRQAIAGALNRATRTRRPRFRDIDWNRTIRANLRHYQPEHRTIIPHTRIGYGRKRSALREVILCIDQSGSMASSVVYSGIFGAVMASIPAVKTHLVVFDTSIVDLTDQLSDPVEVLFSTQLGGGTDINGALAYCQQLIMRPTETILILISDLFEGGVEEELIRRAHAIVGAGVQFVTLLALSDEGTPGFDHRIAAKLTTLGVPSFACTPDQFPDLMAAALERRDLTAWAAQAGLVATMRG